METEEVKQLVVALTDLIKAFEQKVDVSASAYRMPYEHPLSAYDRAVELIKKRALVVPESKSDLTDEKVMRAGNIMAMAFWAELHERAGAGVLPDKLPAKAADYIRQHMRDYFQLTQRPSQ